MTNFFIYGGLGILLLGAIFGLCAAIEGSRSQGWKPSEMFRLDFRNHGPMPRQVKKLVITWGIVTILGFIILGIGLCMGLN